MADFIPLIESAKRGNEDQIEELLELGHEVDEKDGLNCTALHWAAGGGHLGAVRALVAAKADVNAVNKAGDTPLHKSSWKNHTAVVSFLLQSGGSKDIKNGEGKTPFDLARIRDVKVLLSPVIEQDDDGDYGQEDEDSD